MDKMNYIHNGTVYGISRKLADAWMEREGFVVGTRQFDNAIVCVIENAKGRLKLQGVPAAKETMEQVMEEIIREEIELTGGRGKGLW